MNSGATWALQRSGWWVFLSKRVVCVAIPLITMALRFWLDLTGRKPGGGLIELIIGWPYLWFVVLPCFMFGVVAYVFRGSLPRSRLVLITALAALVVVANLPIDPLFQEARHRSAFPTDNCLCDVLHRL